jgi:hypothetical protein
MILQMSLQGTTYNCFNPEMKKHTLFVYMVQFVISSESIAPRRPNKAPDAPTDILFLMKREERTLPPNPERR